METVSPLLAETWSEWKLKSFRFFFIYILLYITPWTWFDPVPGVSSVTQYYGTAQDWLVNAANAYVFHVRDVLVPMGGSGDTSYGWAQLLLFLTLALLGSVLWGALDRNRSNYSSLDYWLCLFVRYFLVASAFGYGIIKIFALQMPFPSLSQLATPLGDFLPMRFSWLYIGYSTPYEVFTGVVETAAALLLLYRRTITLGLLTALGVFINVVMLNLSYDVPVKIYSMHLVFLCLFLFARDRERLASFFLFNRETGPSTVFDPPFSNKWLRWGGIALKAGLLVVLLGMPLYDTIERFDRSASTPGAWPMSAGVYDVRVYAVNGDTLSPSATDSLRWKDVIFDKGGAGSVNSLDTLFRQRYRRGYFFYTADSANKTIAFRKLSGDSLALFVARYDMPDGGTIRLWTKLRDDSLYVELVKIPRHFQLAERQFHWVSESVR